MYICVVVCLHEVIKLQVLVGPTSGSRVASLLLSAGRSPSHLWWHRRSLCLWFLLMSDLTVLSTNSSNPMMNLREAWMLSVILLHPGFSDGVVMFARPRGSQDEDYVYVNSKTELHDNWQKKCWSSWSSPQSHHSIGTDVDELTILLVKRGNTFRQRLPPGSSQSCAHAQQSPKFGRHDGTHSSLGL